MSGTKWLAGLVLSLALVAREQHDSNNISVNGKQVKKYANQNQYRKPHLVFMAGKHPVQKVTLVAHGN